MERDDVPFFHYGVMRAFSGLCGGVVFFAVENLGVCLQKPISPQTLVNLAYLRLNERKTC